MAGMPYPLSAPGDRVPGVEESGEAAADQQVPGGDLDVEDGGRRVERERQAAPVVALTLARLRLAAPPAVVKVPPSRIEPSVPHSTVSTCPLTFGFQPVTRYGAVAENANALLRAMSAVEFGFGWR